MSRILLLFSLLVCLFSCSKDVPIPSGDVVPHPHIPNAEDYYPLTNGNYWIYEYYDIYTNTGLEKFQYRDSVSITGDTIINGEKYVKEKHTYQNWLRLLRDSSGCMISPNGRILFSCCNFSDTFYISHWDNYYTKMIHTDTVISTTVGKFHSISLGYVWNYLAGPKYEYIFYGKGLGMSQYAHWYMPAQIIKIEGRLVKYHLN